MGPVTLIHSPRNHTYMSLQRSMLYIQSSDKVGKVKTCMGEPGTGQVLHMELRDRWDATRCISVTQVGSIKGAGTVLIKSGEYTRLYHRVQRIDQCTIENMGPKGFKGKSLIIKRCQRGYQKGR